MKKICLFIVIIVIAVSLNASRFFFDAGVGSDFTRIIFFNNQGNVVIEGLIGEDNDFLTGPNYYFSLGYRLSNRISLFIRYQTIAIDETFYYRARRSGLLVQPNAPLAEYRVEIKRHRYSGFGVEIYPYSNFIFRISTNNAGARVYYNEVHAAGSPTNSASTSGYGHEILLGYEFPLKDTSILVGVRHLSAQHSPFLTVRHPPNYKLFSTGFFMKLRY